MVDITYAVVDPNFDPMHLERCERAAAALPRVITDPSDAASWRGVQTDIGPMGSRLVHVVGEEARRLIDEIAPGEAVLLNDANRPATWLFEGTAHGIVAAKYSLLEHGSPALVKGDVSAVPLHDSPGRLLQLERSLGTIPSQAWISAAPKRIRDAARSADRAVDGSRGRIATWLGQHGRGR